jgi:heptosyltransferase-2
MRLDRAILLANSFRTALTAWRAGIRERIGFVRYGRGVLLTHPVRPPRVGWRLQPISAVDYYLQLAQAAGASCITRQLELKTTAEDESRVDVLWQRFGWNDGRPVVALNTGGAYGVAKQWPAEYFADLAGRLARSQEAHVLVLCGPAERAVSREIVHSAASSEVQTLADEPISIGLSKSVVRRSQLLVSTDSGPRHFGAAFGIPTITLFGPTDPRWSHNYHVTGIELQRHVACGPCARRQCPLGHHRCMRELTVDQVYRAVQTLLPRSSWQRVA